MKQLGIPYMGSKRKLAEDIVSVIMQDNPHCKYFYDLFGGGGAISFEALQRPQIEKVIYNEIDSAITELLKKVLYEGVTEEFYQWIDRETFNKNKKGKDWFAGVVKTIWSFGNDQRTYLYGKDREEYKKLLHDIVVYNNAENKNILKEYTGIQLDYTKHYTKIELQRILLKNYEKIPENDFKEKIGTCIKITEILPNLNRINVLEKLKYLQNKYKLIISNKSYEQVVIDTPIHETIIYLDPPYKNTERYQHDIDHEKLHKYIINSPYKIYVSSYEWDGLYEVASLNHRSTLSATNKSKRVIERLYCNRDQ